MLEDKRGGTREGTRERERERESEQEKEREGGGERIPSLNDHARSHVTPNTNSEQSSMLYSGLLGPTWI